MPTKEYDIMEIPISVPLIVVQGDTLDAPIYQQYQSDGITPENLAGATIFCCGQLADGEDVTLEVERSDAVGEYRPVASDEVTALWPVGRGSYKIRVTDTAGTTKTYWHGPLIVKGVLPCPA
jgi:hypothetical protein